MPLIALTWDTEDGEYLPSCDSCKKGADEADDEEMWKVCFGISVYSTLEYARFCPDCWDTLEWGQVYAPGGKGESCFPLGVIE